MMTTFVIRLIGGLGLLLSVVGGYAQESDWKAWLYNPASGGMTLIDSAGKVLDGFTLSLPPRYEFFPFEVGVSHSGTRIGYVVSNGERRQVRVYDTASRQLIADYDLSDLVREGIGFIPDEGHSFNETDTALAFGFSLKAGGWQIAVLDLKTGLVTLILRSASPPVAAAGVPVDAGITPVVRQFEGTKLTFTMVQTAAKDGPPEQGSYTWDTLSNSVTPDSAYTTLDSDRFTPTGEIIMAAADPALPNQSGSFRSGQVNTVQVYVPGEAQPYPFYTVPNLSFYWPRFIQNGERVLLGAFDARGNSGWVVIERDGMLVGEWRAAGGVVVSSIAGTADGFVYTGDAVNPGSGHTTLFFVNTRDGLVSDTRFKETGTPLWSSAPNTYPRIVWIKDSRLAPQKTYKKWARLSAP